LKKYKVKISIILLLVSAISPVFGWEKKDSEGFIQPGRRISSSVILQDDQISYSYRTFKVRVPDNVFKMEVKIDNSSADLDIFMNFNREIENYDDVDFSSTEELHNETITLSRMSSLPLSSGIYYFDIVYPLDILPVIDDREATAIPFGVTAKLTSLGSPERLYPGSSVNSSLPFNGNMMKLFTVDVNEDAEALRIDLYNTRSDLDLLVRYNKPAYTFEQADYSRASYLGQESLIINSDSVKPLRTGRYYITVFDRIEDNSTDPFSLISSFSEQVPPFLNEFPVLPSGSEALEKALYATVEISTETGSGSGCLVSDDGYIVTGLHVITGTSGAMSEEIYISMNLSNYYPPKELFRAEIIDVRNDEDLALLKIVSGLYGQELPDQYKFPYYSMALENHVVMGQKLSFLGYPQIGSESSRASISLTRGIVSGFDTMDFGYLIKTDGEINSGNSGGAAFNEYYELIGFPMSVISDDGGQIAFIHPVSLIPDEWLETIGLITGE